MRTATSISSRLVLMGLLVCRAALAQAPNELFDVIKFLEYDIYDYRPEEQAAWEEFRYSKQAVRVNLGSVTLKELFAIAEAQANLRPVPWLGSHVDLVDFRTREQEVTRLLVDFSFRTLPWLELLATGSPALRKDEGALGLGAMAASADRTQYAVLRLLDDAPFFNGKNPEGGVRDSAVWRLQSELRGSVKGLSGWLRADLGGKTTIRYQAGPLQSQANQRNDLEFHLRWVPPSWSSREGGIGVRGTLRFLDNDRTDLSVREQIRRTLGFARAYATLPISAVVRVYSVLLLVSDRGRGFDLGQPFTFSRWDVGIRAGSTVDLGPFRLDGGYAVLRSQREVQGGSSFEGLSPVAYGDKIYVSAQWNPRKNIFLKFLVSHQIFSGSFGGFNGSLGAIF
jgi:hypothetical protein